MPYSHLHCYSQFSILQSTLKVQRLVSKAKEFEMPAIALTDKGNMYGAYQFLDCAQKEGIKGILGCEFRVCKNHTDKSIKDNGNSIILLAKNKKGYHNLVKLSSISHIDGFYYVPRIDKELVCKYKTDLIFLTGGLGGIIPYLILNVGEKQAEDELIWWYKQFGDDFYIELIRHNLPENDAVNETLLKFAKKHNIKIIATNDTFYEQKEHHEYQDILLCIRDGEKKNTPIGRGRSFRFGFANDDFYFKSQEEMKTLFADLPEAITNIQEVVDKCEKYTLKQEVLLPKFDIPKEFEDPEDKKDNGNRGENAYLRYLTYQGAEKKYRTLTDEIKERLDFELKTIETTGYSGYFLIVQDLTSQARKMNVSVGPGRGSAAGSAVAYCTGITNIDPIQYNLLFERFLNPERVSLPDIDIDFDDEGRSKIIEWVAEKYGYEQVAQIITYGTMAAKSSIRDTARVLDLPLSERNNIVSLVPDTLGFNLNKYFNLEEKEIKEKLKEKTSDFLKLKRLSEGNNLEAKVVNSALSLEGAIRNTGVHACGVIITPKNITNYVPVSKSKDGEIITQFDNSVVENAGLLKMDFLGLKTLTLIKDTIEIIKSRTGKIIDPDKDIALDDPKTYELFQKGDTVGIFQYESLGMQKHMRNLKPTVFADLIAMNALYRPGPMEYIPSFIRRKHGQEEIKYDLPDMEEYLQETYGITIYQEQVMLLSQKLAGFTKGEADVLRKAMGKKILSLLEELKPKFLNGCKERGHNVAICEKIWKDWEAFALYAFNKSHSTCYAYIAYQTAYLKANYPAEYMASVLSNNMNNLEKLTFFMEECKRMGIPVLNPDVNESEYKFTVNYKGAIRFGMGGIKGVGEGAVESIINSRSDGKYTSIFNMMTIVDPTAVNKRAFESLVYAGAFDSLGEHHRAQLFHKENEITFGEKLCKLAKQYQQKLESNQISLFGETLEEQVSEPVFPPCESWTTMQELSFEKEVIGIFVSGHPLDPFKLEMKNFCTKNITEIKTIESDKNQIGKPFKFAGVINDCKHLTTKNGKGWGIITIQDYTDTYEIRMFGEDYLKFKIYFIQNGLLFLKASFQMRWNGEGTELKIQEIKQLQDVLHHTQKITLTLHAHKINDELTTNLDKITAHPEGKCTIAYKIKYTDEEKNIVLPLISVDRKVNIEKSFVQQIDELATQGKLEYQIS